jgi:hypothetical protein
MSHTSTVNWAFLNKHAQSRVKPAHAIVVKSMGGACSNTPCTAVMEQERQKSKTLLYTAKFEHEVVQCTEEKENRKATRILGVDENNVQLWWKLKAGISKYKV